MPWKVRKKHQHILAIERATNVVLYVLLVLIGHSNTSHRSPPTLKKLLLLLIISPDDAPTVHITSSLHHPMSPLRRKMPSHRQHNGREKQKGGSNSIIT